jgi:dTDP-glucose 4,6-dehydratase
LKKGEEEVKILVTGGAGFIGSNFIRYLQTLTQRGQGDFSIINLDKLTYAGNLENLTQLPFPEKYQFVKGDVCDGDLIEHIFQDGIDAVINFAAESHVDRSIIDPGVFIRTNVQGVQVLLQTALKFEIRKIVQVSTDEVYGSLSPQDPPFRESTPLAPNSPYAASKAAADLLARAYYQTFGVPVVITRCSNNYGPFQFPEKLIPLMITNALEDRPLPIYGDGLNVRDWIHVEDHCRALRLVLEKGKPGEIYNIGGKGERTNLEIVETILQILKKPKSLIQFVADRPGHDRRYAIDSSKIQAELGWSPTISLEQGLLETVEWYVSHSQWWRRVKTGEYQDFYRKNYSERMK